MAVGRRNPSADFLGCGTDLRDDAVPAVEDVAAVSAVEDFTAVEDFAFATVENFAFATDATVEGFAFATVGREIRDVSDRGAASRVTGGSLEECGR